MKTKFREDRPNQISRKQQNKEMAHFRAMKAQAVAQADQPILDYGQVSFFRLEVAAGRGDEKAKAEIARRRA